MPRSVCSEGTVLTVFSGTAITSGATATSDTFHLKPHSNFGVWYQASPGSAASGVRIYFEESATNVSADFVVPDSASDIVTALTGGLAHCVGLSLTPMPYLRFRATAGLTDATDLTLTLRLFTQ